MGQFLEHIAHKLANFAQRMVRRNPLFRRDIGKQPTFVLELAPHPRLPNRFAIHKGNHKSRRAAEVFQRTANDNKPKAIQIAIDSMNRLYVLFDDGTIKTGRWSTYRHEDGGRWVWSDVNLEKIELRNKAEIPERNRATNATSAIGKEVSDEPTKLGG
jgi:hypothetical protein